MTRRRTDARVQPQPARRRARRRPTCRRRARRRRSPRRPCRRVPRRLPARASGASSRRELSSGQLLGRRRHERARARHRRRRPRRRRAQRLPRHARVDVAAGRAGPGATERGVAGGARRRRRPARPVVRAHPRRAVRPPARAAVVNPPNPFVLLPQLACAAHELPLTPDDERWFGRRASTTRVRAARARRPAHACATARAVLGGRGTPAPGIGLRSGLVRRVPHRRADDEPLVGTVDDGRVFEVVHPGAIYLHQGRQYRVDRARPRRPRRRRRARRRATSTPRPAADTTSRSSATDEQRAGRPARRVAPRRGRGDEPGGRLPAHDSIATHERHRDRATLDLPPTRARDPGVLVHGRRRACSTAPASSRGRCPARCTPPSTRLIGMLPLFTICDRWDVGGVSMADAPATPARRRSSSTTATRAAPASPSSAYAAGRRHLDATLRARRALPVPRRLPVVRAVAEVRQLERTARQGGGGRRCCSPVAGPRLISPAPSRIDTVSGHLHVSEQPTDDRDVGRVGVVHLHLHEVVLGPRWRRDDVGGPERQADRRERRLLGGVRAGARDRGGRAPSLGVDHEHLVAHEHADLHEQQEQHHEHREDEGQLDRRLAPVTPAWSHEMFFLIDENTASRRSPTLPAPPPMSPRCR